MNHHFVNREQCPACNNGSSHELCDSSYTDLPISKYLENLYKSIGSGVEFEFLDGAHFIVDECDHCGLVYQREVPGEALMQRIYGEWIKSDIVHDNFSRGRSANFILSIAKETTRVINYLNKKPGEVKFLDFGIGTGNWCLMAKSFGCDVYGTDLSSGHVDRAKVLGIKVLAWDEIKNHSFDYINSEQVFEHLSNPLETLIHLSKALTQGGIIRVNVPPGWDIKRQLVKWDWHASLSQSHPDILNNIAPLQHINCFNRNSLIEMGRTADLFCVDIPPIGRNPGMCEKIKQVLEPIANLVTFGQRKKANEQRLQKITNVFYTNAKS